MFSALWRWELRGREVHHHLPFWRIVLLVLWIIFVVDNPGGWGWLAGCLQNDCSVLEDRSGYERPAPPLHQAEWSELSRARCASIASLALESALRNFSKTRSVNCTLALRGRGCWARIRRNCAVLHTSLSLSLLYLYLWVFIFILLIFIYLFIRYIGTILVLLPHDKAPS